MRTDGHDDADLVLRRFGGGGAATPCPDAAALAALAEGRLPPDERAAVEDHVAACDECRRAVAAVAAEAAPAASSASPAGGARGRVLWMSAIGIAAAVLLAIGWSGFRAPETPAPSTERELASAASDLVAARPELFEGFRPLDHAERSARGTDVERGGLVLRRPVGTVLGDRPTFSWAAVAGAASYSVAVVGEDGRELWRRDARTATLAWPADAPPLARGSAYVGEVSTAGPLGRVEGRRAFRVASDAAGKALEDAKREIASRVRPALRPLVLAHYALRKGFLEEAEAAAKEYVAGGGDPVGAETWSLIERRLGVAPPGR